MVVARVGCHLQQRLGGVLKRGRGTQEKGGGGGVARGARHARGKGGQHACARPQQNRSGRWLTHAATSSPPAGRGIGGAWGGVMRTLRRLGGRSPLERRQSRRGRGGAGGLRPPDLPVAPLSFQPPASLAWAAAPDLPLPRPRRPPRAPRPAPPLSTGRGAPRAAPPPRARGSARAPPLDPPMMASLAGEVYPRATSSSAQATKSSKTFCLLDLLPASRHSTPYSPPPRRLACSGVERCV
jgi:hypothetical protein